MIGKSLKSSGIRRLGLQPLSPNDSQTNQHQPHPQPQPGQAHQAQQQQPATAPSVSARSSKAQALSAFRSLVEGSAVVRPSTAHANDHTTAAAAAASHDRDQQQQQEGPAQTYPSAVPSTAADSRFFSDPSRQPTAPASAQQTPAHPQVPGFLANTAPTAPAQARALLFKGPPNQLIPKATKALEKLQQQLSSRTLTYLYQFDGLLSTASSALDALAGFLHSTSTHSGSTAVAPAQHGLQQLLQDQQQAAGDPGAQSAAVLDLVLQICMLTWVSNFCCASKLHF
jgi:hypothetical protein